MDLLEYQGKDLYRASGLPVPHGFVVSSAVEAKDAVEKLGGQAVLKIQVATGHRGQRGGIQKVDKESAEERAAELFELKLDGHKSKQLLVEEIVSIEQELYLAIMLDRQERSLQLMLSRAGGVSVEEAAEQEGVLRIPMPIAASEHKKVLRVLGGKESAAIDMLGKLEQLVRSYDALLVEVNPLARTTQGDFMLLDSKITIDDNALYRQPEIAALQMLGTKDEQAAHEAGFSFVELGGTVAVIGNGAGLVMATLDALDRAGAKPANFLDVGGGAQADKTRKAVQVALAQPHIKALFVNIFGGITRADEVARGLAEALLALDVSVPVIVRLAGNGAATGKEILEKQGIATFDDMEEAAQTAAQKAKQAQQ